METTAITVTAVLGIILTFALPFVSLHRSFKKRFQEKDERELFVAGIHANAMQKTLYTAACLGPIPFILLIFLKFYPDLKTLFICLSMAMFFAGMSTAGLFRQILIISNKLHEYKKSQVEKEELT